MVFETVFQQLTYYKTQNPTLQQGFETLFDHNYSLTKFITTRHISPAATFTLIT